MGDETVRLPVPADEEMASRSMRPFSDRKATVHRIQAQRIWLLAAVTTLLVVGWAGMVLAVHDFHFVVFTPRGKTGFEVFLALLRFFTALVLVLFPDEVVGHRLRWVAVGFCILGLGGIGFGYITPLEGQPHGLEIAMYGSLLTRTLGGLAFAIGLALPHPPLLDRR